MLRFGDRLTQATKSESGSVPLVVSLMITLVMFAQTIIYAGAVGSTWLRLKHDSTEASKRAAGLFLMGNDGCQAVSEIPQIQCEFDGVVVQVGIDRNMEFWFLKNRLRASSRVALNFPTP